MFGILQNIFDVEQIFDKFLLGILIFIIIGSLYIWKRKIKNTILFLIIIILLFITLVTPIFTVERKIFDFGINESYQLMLENKYGIENFYHSVIHALNSDNFSKLEPSYQRKGYISNNEFIVLERFHIMSDSLISTVIIANHNKGITFSGIDAFSKNYWRDDFVFFSNRILIREELLKINLIIGIICFISFYIGFLYVCHKFHVLQQMCKIEKVLFIFLMSAISILWLNWGYHLAPGFYLKDYKAELEILTKKENIQALSASLEQYTMPQLVGLEKEIQLKNKVFISRDNFLKTRFIRMELDLFNYAFFVLKEDDIIYPSKMVVTRLAENLYSGRYEEYILRSNVSTSIIYMLLSLQLLSLMIFLYFAVKNVKSSE